MAVEILPFIKKKRKVKQEKAPNKKIIEEIICKS